MKILLITLFVLLLVFYGIGFGMLVKALKTEDVEKKNRNQPDFMPLEHVYLSYF